MSHQESEPQPQPISEPGSQVDEITTRLMRARQELEEIVDRYNDNRAPRVFKLGADIEAYEAQLRALGVDLDPPGPEELPSSTIAEAHAELERVRSEEGGEDPVERAVKIDAVDPAGMGEHDRQK